MKIKHKIICVFVILVVLFSMCIIPISASWQDSNRDYRYSPQYILSTVGKDGDLISINLIPILEITNTTSINENLINSNIDQLILYNNIIVDNQYDVRYDLEIEDYIGSPLYISAENFYISNYNFIVPSITIPDGYHASVSLNVDFIRSSDVSQTLNNVRYGSYDVIGVLPLIPDSTFTEIFGNDHYVFIKKITYEIILSDISVVNAVATYNLDRQTRDTTITDLTGTEWYIPSGWSAPMSYGYYTIDGLVTIPSRVYNGEPYTWNMYELGIGYAIDPESFSRAPAVDQILLWSDPSAIQSNEEFYISFYGNSTYGSSTESLIAWLEENGSLVVDTPTLATPTLSYDSTTDIFTASGFDNYTTGYHIYANGQYITNRSLPDNTFTLESLGLSDGTYNITVVSVASGYNDSLPSNAVSVVVFNPIVISFKYNLMSQEDYTSIFYGYNQEYAYNYHIENGGTPEIEVDLTSWITTAVKGFLDAELFPGFSFGGILGIFLAITVVTVFLKIFAGG